MTNALIKRIKDCDVCKAHLPYPPNPIVQFSISSKILIIGQAPGVKAHESSIPWDDKSGERLRQWLQLTDKQFYDPTTVALVPMGFCYPGRGKSGDLPPRKECAPKWLDPVLSYLKNIELEIYIGKYACDRKFGSSKNLTELIKDQRNLQKNQIILPHPSPRNNIWLSKHPWFEVDILPLIRRKIKRALS